MENDFFEAGLLNTPYEKEDPYHSLSMPVYNSAAFEFDSAEAMEAAFCGRSAEHTYSRITNPTVQYFEKRIQSATGALGVTALSSGMAAITNTLLVVAQSGKNIVTSNHLFGNTYSLLNSTLRAFGVEPRFCDLTNVDEVRSQVDENTCAIFLEVITNPQLEVADLKLLASIAGEAGVPLIADTTIVPFQVFCAGDFGVDIEIVSSTKYISGGATGIGGLIIDYGTFDWNRSEKLIEMSRLFGNKAFAVKLRKEVHRNVGAYMTPQTAYMQNLGLETMDIRYARQATSCYELASRLQQLSGVESVNYPGLPDNPYFELSTRQFGKYPGAMFTLDLSSKADCFRFMNKLKVVRRATNLFDNKTLAIHPASTIYGTFSESQCMSMDVSPKTIRISVGLEEVDCLFDDLSQAIRI